MYMYMYTISLYLDILLIIESPSFAKATDDKNYNSMMYQANEDNKEDVGDADRNSSSSSRAESFSSVASESEEKKETEVMAESLAVMKPASNKATMFHFNNRPIAKANSTESSKSRRNSAHSASVAMELLSRYNSGYSAAPAVSRERSGSSSKKKRSHSVMNKSQQRTGLSANSPASSVVTEAESSDSNKRRALCQGDFKVRKAKSCAADGSEGPSVISRSRRESRGLSLSINTESDASVSVSSPSLVSPGGRGGLVAKPREQWASDCERVMCSKCCSPFSLLTRRHHCRLCGEIFCSDCISALTISATASEDGPSSSRSTSRSRRGSFMAALLAPSSNKLKACHSCIKTCTGHNAL
jgi:hypothetical protein